MALVHIDLTEQLGDGQFVDIRDPRLLPWGVQKKLQSSLKDQSMDSQIAFAESLTVELVKQANVSDEDGNPIQAPFTAESVANVPAAVIEAVALKFAEMRKVTVEKN